MSTPIASASLLPLTCFVRVVEAGSFAEAARRLGMTTSGVSKAISRFEAEHGVRLLHRSTHALSLTDEGEQLLEDAREVLRGAERFGHLLSQAADGGRGGRVRISVPPGFARACLLPVLPALLDAHPEIQVEIRATYDPVDLADAGVDLALRTGQMAGLPGHVTQTLFSSPWCAYAAPGYLLRRGTPGSPDDLAGHDLIGFRNSGDGRVRVWRFQDPAVEGTSGVVRHDARARIVFDDGAAAYDMACQGHGIVWAPEWLALGDLECGRVVEVLKAWRSGEMRMSLVRRERRLTPRRIQVVTDYLCAAARLWQSRDIPPPGR